MILNLSNQNWYIKLRNYISPLYFAVFFMCCASSIRLIAVPFIIKELGGTDAAIGCISSAWFTAYLIGLLLFSPFFDHFKVKHIVLFSLITILISNVATMTVLWLYVKNYELPYPVWIVMGLIVLTGFLTAPFWAPIMGWASSDVEKKNLNTKLSIFNITWLLGFLVTPELGGLLTQKGMVWPFAGILCFLILAITFITFSTNKPAASSLCKKIYNTTSNKTPDGMRLKQFKMMSRIALVTSFVCVGIARTNLAVFTKYRLGYTEIEYSSSMTIMSFAIMCIFIITGRFHQWHYKFNLFIFSQLLLLAAFVFILKSPNIYAIYFATGLIGAGQGFVYISSLFYGVSGRIKRSAPIALHEFLLSMGFATGAFCGGLVSNSFGEYAPYWMCIGFVAIGLILQVVTYIYIYNSSDRLSLKPLCKEALYEKN